MLRPSDEIEARGPLRLTLDMRHLRLVLVSFLACLCAHSQSTGSDEALLSKARGLYDAPFTRQLVSFDCSIQFDWKKHFIDTVGTVPAAAIPTVNRLQSLPHRVFVDRSGAVVSEIPRATDLSGTPHAADLEAAFQAMVSSGLNAWLPFATNVILPMKPTTFTFQQLDTGFNVVMKGANVSATLNLLPDMRIASVTSELPQPQHFETDFAAGPNGYLLQSVKTGSGADSHVSWDAVFAYRYQNIQGFQIPAGVAVTQMATGEKWEYSLDDCKAVTGTVVNVRAPEKQRP
jgi:hypothetical protein